MKRINPIPLTALCLILVLFSCSTNKKESEAKISKSAIADTSVKATLLTDFENNGNELAAPYKGDIYAFTDENENPKGTSTINELVKLEDGNTKLKLSYEKGKGAKGSDKFLKISGNVTNVCPFGFVGVGVNFNKNKELIDITGFKGVKFWARGNGNNFTVRIESSPVKDYAYHECQFFADEEWEEFVILFENFRQPKWKSSVVNLEDALKAAVGIQWQTNSRPIDNYFLCLDNIEFIR